MAHHDVFSRFNSVDVIGTGNHIYDFLGVATDVSFKKGWERFSIRLNSVYRAAYPPLNEHYFDWIALLESVEASSGTFRMAELGAGWAPWLIRAQFAARQNPKIDSVKLLGVEADPTHFKWMKQHFLDNDVLASKHELLYGAVAPESTTLRFPKIHNPGEDYGASVRQVYGDREYIEVKGFTIEEILNRFDGPVDFVHTDIQGAEYEVFPDAMELLNNKVRRIMIGTHISSEKHEFMKSLFVSHGWKIRMDFPRNEVSNTRYGEVKFGDGFLYFENAL